MSRKHAQIKQDNPKPTKQKWTVITQHLERWRERHFFLLLYFSFSLNVFIYCIYKNVYCIKNKYNNLRKSGVKSNSRPEAIITMPTYLGPMQQLIHVDHAKQLGILSPVHAKLKRAHLYYHLLPVLTLNACRLCRTLGGTT